jgi:uncharacterized membrane protein YvbJ
LQCKHCGTVIADKALICYKCGTATTDAKYAPAPLKRSRRGPGLPIVVIAIVILLLVLLYYLRLMA